MYERFVSIHVHQEDMSGPRAIIPTNSLILDSIFVYVALVFSKLSIFGQQKIAYEYKCLQSREQLNGTSFNLIFL